MTRRSHLTRALLATAVAAVATLGALAPGSAQSTTPPFDASAAADGVRLVLEIPGAPLTAKLFDSGGPTAQVALTSLGTSRGYAAMPDPGELVRSAPGLAVGLINQGAVGLPPIEFPSLPDYPLSISSDAGANPDAELGAGVYELRSSSAGDSTTATGVGGVTTPAGNARSRATADAHVDADGSVAVEAISDLEGLTIGPIGVGRVRSIARMGLAPDGSVTRETALDVDGFRIGGIDLEIDTDELRVAGQTIPVPVEGVLQQLLAPAGFEVEYRAAEEFDDAVVAPALVLTTDVDLTEFGVGSDTGTFRIILGGATAALTGPSPLGPTSPAPSVPATPATPGVIAPPAAAPSGGSSGGSLGVTPARPTTGGSSPAPTTPAVATPPAGADETAAPVPAVSSALPVRSEFDVLPTYLTVIAAAAGLYAVGQIIRLLGVRTRWT